MLLFAIISMAGCDDDPEMILNDGRSISEVNFYKEESLVYDSTTRIVYIRQYTFDANYVYTLYLSENGLPYKFINGELVEVNPFDAMDTGDVE